MILIIDYGSQYTKNISRSLNDLKVDNKIIIFDEINFDQELEAKGIILSGGPDSAYKMKDDKKLYYPLLMNVPVLGICYGHQLLAEALGGRSGFNPNGREIGTIQVNLTESSQDDPLFGTLGSTLTVHASHRQVVLQPPLGATILGSNSMDPHQVIRFGPRVWGVQFHPEYQSTFINPHPLFISFINATFLNLK